MSDQPAPENRFRGKVQQTEAPNVKTLKIKVNALKRTIKDLEFAKKEVEVEQRRLQTFKETNPDKVSQQENVVNEAAMMVPHSGNRIRACVKDLRDYLEKEGSTVEDEELKAAAQEAIESGDSAVADS